MSSKIGARFLRRTDVKLTVLYIFVFFLSALIICGFLYFRLKHQLIKEIDRFLLDETEELSVVFSNDLMEEGIFKHYEEETNKRTYYPICFRVLNSYGKPFYISEGFKAIGYTSDQEILIRAKEGRRTSEDIRSPARRTPYRFVSTPIYKGGSLAYVLQVGTHLRFVRKSLSGFKRNILAAFPIVLILGSVGGWLLARKSLSPIGYIASTAQKITSKNLSERLKRTGADDEMDDLIGTMNDMIARLEESFQRMAEFTADASHELKTPLCAMRGEAEVLLSKMRSGAEYQEGLAHFIEQFDQMNRMINDLILLSKFDASQVELRMAPLRLDLLLKGNCQFYQVMAEQKKIGWEMDDFPEVTIMGDKARLQQLFTNLIDNAIKYTVEGRVRVTIEKDKDVVSVKVSDTGIGIPEEEQTNIFKRFYRVDKSRSRETGGVGLGLSIADWIAQAHQGRIEVISAPSKGSTFIVILPIYDAALSNPSL